MGAISPGIDEFFTPGNPPDMNQFKAWAEAVEAAVENIALSATSVTSTTIQTGVSKTFAFAGASFGVGALVRVAAAASPTANYMVGTVTANAAGSITVQITKAVGSGTYASWIINTTGETGDVASGTQVLGAPGTPVIGNAICTANTQFVFLDPATSDGYLTGVRVYSSGGGTIQIRRYTVSGSVVTQVGPGVTLTLADGVNSLSPTHFGRFPVNAGERLGFFTGTANITYISGGTPYSGGHYAALNSEIPSQFTDTAPGATHQLQVGFDIATGEVAAAINEAYLVKGGIGFLKDGVQQIGRVETPVTGSGSSGFVFVFGNPVVADGAITAMRAYATGSGHVIIKRYIISGANFVQSGPDTRIRLEVGLNVFDQSQLGNIPVQKGEYLGFIQDGCFIAFTTTGTGTYYYRNSDSNNAASFAVGASNSTNRLQIGFDVTLGTVSRVEGTTAQLATIDYLGDQIIDCDMRISGATINVTAYLNRNGVIIPVTGSVGVTATTGANIRIDRLYLDATTLTFGISNGTERADDPVAFIGPLSASTWLPVALVRSVSSVISLTPVWRVHDGQDLSIMGIIEKELRRSRRYLRKLRGKIRRGEAIKIVGFGDSITAVQQNVPSTATPNGVERDAATQTGGATVFLGTVYGTDVLSTIPTYTSLQLGRGDDGGGSVHTRIGWNWELVAALEQYGYTLGTDLTYDNFGVGGYATSNAVSGTTPQAWLNNAAALKGDVVVVALGMNERGNTSTEARLAIIVDTFKAQGSEVILVDVPRPRGGTTADWEYTNRVIKRVAEYKDCAHLNFTPLTDNRFIGALGIPRQECSAANKNNHPGIEEFRAYGRELARLVCE